MVKYNEEFKKEVVDYYLTTDNGYKKTGAYFSIHLRMVQTWVRIFKKEGIEGLKVRKNKTQYTAMQKQKAVLMALNDKLSYYEIITRLNLRDVSLIGRWLQDYCKYGIEGLTPKERVKKPMKPIMKQEKPHHEKTREELLETLEFLELENLFLKKRKALIQKLNEQAKQKKKQR